MLNKGNRPTPFKSNRYWLITRYEYYDRSFIQMEKFITQFPSKYNEELRGGKTGNQGNFYEVEEIKLK